MKKFWLVIIVKVDNETQRWRSAPSQVADYVRDPFEVGPVMRRERLTQAQKVNVLPRGLDVDEGGPHALAHEPGCQFNSLKNRLKNRL